MPWQLLHDHISTTITSIFSITSRVHIHPDNDDIHNYYTDC